MRVHLAMESFPKLSETWNLSVVSGLNATGHEVSVSAINTGDDGILSKDDSRVTATFALGKGVPFHTKADKLAVYGSSCFQAMSSLPLPFLSLLSYVMRRHIGAQGAILEAATIKSVERYDIIHGLFGPSARRASMLLNSGFYKGKLVATFGGFDVNSIIPRYGKAYYADLFATASRLIAVSKFIEQRLIEAGADREKIRVVYYGVDLDRFAYRPSSPLEGRSPRFISVGRLVDCKGIEYAIRAVAELKKRGIFVEYSVVGSGPEQSKLSALIQELGLEDRVEMVGAVPHLEVRDRMFSADILLAPGVVGSDGSTEALGGSIIEAHAVGLPVICSDLGGMPEAIVPEGSGYLVPANDHIGLADAMVRMTENAAKWAEMGAIGRAHIERNFSSAGFLERLIQVYEEALQS